MIDFNDGPKQAQTNVVSLMARRNRPDPMFSDPMFLLFTQTIGAIGGALKTLPNEHEMATDVIVNAALHEVLGQAYNADWNLEDVLAAVRHHFHSITRNIDRTGGTVPSDYVTAKGRDIIEYGRVLKQRSK